MGRGDLRCWFGVGYRMRDRKGIVIGLRGWLRRLLHPRLDAAAESEDAEREKQERAAEGDGSSGSVSCWGLLRESQARALVRARAGVVGSIVPGEMRGARCAAVWGSAEVD